MRCTVFAFLATVVLCSSAWADIVYSPGLKDLTERGLYKAPDGSATYLEAPGYFLKPMLIAVNHYPVYLSTQMPFFAHVLITKGELTEEDGQDLLQTLDLTLEEVSQDKTVIFIPMHSDGNLRYVYHPDKDGDYVQWLSELRQCEFGVINQHTGPINVYWVNDGEEVLNLDGLERQGISWMTAYLGHKFVARDAKTGVLVNEHEVTGSEIFVIQRNAECTFEHCDPTNWNEIKTTPLRQIWNEGNATERTRIYHNQNHPKMYPHFTPVGFRKSRMPKKTWAILSTYWRHNKPSAAVEKWTPGSTFVNHRAHATFMAWLPEHGKIKKEIFEDMKPLMESWSGISPLIPTSFYGIRAYTRGSTLENHVDRASTHVISVIFNVDQEVDTDWPLEIYDHDGNVHHITLQPGEMVFYESATCIHGRPTPLDGKYFANSFIHYMPADKKIWNVAHD